MPLTQAQPALEFIPPDFDPLVFWGVRSLLPFYRRWGALIADIEVENAETLALLYEQFQADKTRFLLAFRHPSTNDPVCMAHLLWNSVPQAARQKGIELNPAAVHVHFVYDRGIPLWAGKAVGWLYSKLGGTPIKRGGIDRAGLRSIRQLFANGKFPMAAAPEGATNGHNEMISPLEPGISQFGFWCAEDLQKEGRSQEVLIVPIGIQYRFVDAPWTTLERLLRQLEAEVGLPLDETLEGSLQDGISLTAQQESVLYQRLFQLGERLLSLIEDFYRKFYRQPLPVPAPEAAVTSEDVAQTEASKNLANEQLAQRLQRLMDAALAVAEQYFDLTPKGTITDRCRRLEQAGWERIFREDLKQFETLSPVERGLADRVAEEAHLRLWHMRLVESFVSVTGRYVLEKTTGDRFAETLLIVCDTVARIKGKSPFPRPQIAPQKAHVTVGTPISISDRWDDYQTNRRQAVATLTQDLQTALESMIRQ